MIKRFSSVSEMLHSTADGAFAARFDRETANRSVARALFGLRNAEGLTQEELASKMGITQSAVSRLEHSDNERIRFEEVAQYVGSLGYKISVDIHKERNAVEWVKYHVLETQKHLRFLAELCRGDASMANSVAGFFQEAAYNSLRGIQDATALLEHVLPPPEQTETLQVVTPEGVSVDRLASDEGGPCPPEKRARPRAGKMATAE